MNANIEYRITNIECPIFSLLNSSFSLCVSAPLRFSIFLRPRVKRPVHLLDIFTVDMGIYFGGRDVRMPEELLDDANIGASFKEVGCEGVPERVGARMPGDARLDNVFAENFPESHPRERPPPHIEKKNILCLFLPCKG